MTTDPVTFLKPAGRSTLGSAAECLGKALPATTASPGRRDSGQEEEPVSVASVTMATSSFVSPESRAAASFSDWHSGETAALGK